MLVVGSRAVRRLMHVLGRKVNTKFQPLLSTGLCQFFNHIAFAAPPLTILYRGLRVLRRLKAETIVMLCRKDHNPEACFFQ